MPPVVDAAPAALNRGVGIALIALAGLLFTLLGLARLPVVGAGLLLGPAALLLAAHVWLKPAYT